MRSYVLFVAGLLALVLPQRSVLAQIVPAPTNSSVKLRLEIEIRGVLSVTGKSVTITNKETIYEYTSSGLQSRQVDKVWVLELDENLKKMAKTLHGKEIEVTGKCLLLGVKSQADTGKTPRQSVLAPYSILEEGHLSRCLWSCLRDSPPAFNHSCCSMNV
jgi:hypothetical protein